MPVHFRSSHAAHRYLLPANVGAKLRRFISASHKLRLSYACSFGLLLLCAIPAYADTPTLKRSWGFAGVSGNQADAGDDFKIQLEAPGTPRAVSAGDLIVLSVAYPKSAPAPTISDDQSNTWASATNCANTGLSTPRSYQLFYAVNAAAGTSLITVHFGATQTNIQFAVALFYNTATFSPLDGAGKCVSGITPTNNNAPNILPGPLTTSTDGDLIFNQVFDEGGGGTIGAQTLTGITFGSGFTGLYGEMVYGAASQFEIQSAHGSVNPGMTFVQSSHDSFASLAIAIKAGSGGAPPGAGISIIRSEMYFENDVANTTQPCVLPASGNLIVVVDEAGTIGVALDGVTDSNSNTYTSVANSPLSYPQLFYAANASPGNSLSCTLSMGAGGGTSLIGIFDITGAATSPLDTGAAAANSSTLTAARSGATYSLGTQESGSEDIVDAPSIVPSSANELVIGAVNIGVGPPSSAISFTFDYVGASWDGGGDSNGFSNGDGLSHVFNTSATTQSFGYHIGEPCIIMAGSGGCVSSSTFSNCGSSFFRCLSESQHRRRLGAANLQLRLLRRLRLPKYLPGSDHT